MNIRLSLILVIPVLIGCIEHFELVSEKYDELLVVEGFISNEPGPYEIRLSTSSQIDPIVWQPVSGYKVEIEDNEGTFYQLLQTKKGLYVTDSFDFVGEIGKSYRLHLYSPEGKHYMSAMETISKPVAIAKISAEYEEKTDPETHRTLYGYQFSVDSDAPESDTNFLLWQAEATYEYQADFKIDFYYDGQIHPYPNKDSLRTCYRTKKISEVFTYSSINAERPSVIGKKLHFVSTQTKELSIKYSLNVRQMSLSKEAYEFWNGVREINEIQGQVFSKQPYQIAGNIHNVDNPEEQVIGYFMAAGTSTKREFFTWRYAKFDYPECVITDTDIMAYGDIFRSTPGDWPIYITTGKTEGPRAVVSVGCIDCRSTGGTLDKPKFWE